MFLWLAGMAVPAEQQLMTPTEVLPPGPALATATVPTPAADAPFNPAVATAATAPEVDTTSIPAVITAATTTPADDDAAASNPAKTPAEIADSQLPAAVLQASGAVLPTDDTTAEPVAPGPVLGRRTRRRRRGETVTAAAATDPAFTSVTCKLDAAGYVVDVMFTRSGTTTTGCTGTTAPVTGGRNVVLDFADSQIIQVRNSTNKLRPDATAHALSDAVKHVCPSLFLGTTGK
jgi:hypothetical protein